MLDPRPSPDAPPTPVTFDDVLRAAERLAGVAHRTPIARSGTLDRLAGAQVHAKCESLQRVGAFKLRGAYNALAALDPAARQRGVLTWSSGNHAQALALAASLLGIRATIVMPTDAPAVKRAATEGYLRSGPGPHGDIVLYDRAATTRESLGTRIARERGLTIVPPYDHPDVIAGQGTAALELLEDAGPLDVLVVPCGGGGLLSGCAIAARAMAPACRIVGVEPAAADAATRSFRTRTLHEVRDPRTIADGARTPSLGRWTFPLVLANVDAMVTVTEGEIACAMQFVWERMKLVVEPTAALGIAALLTADEVRRIDARGKRVGVILTGGNVDPTRIGELLAAH